MTQQAIQEIGALNLASCGYVLDTSAACLGSLRSSIDLVDDAQALRARMREDGYLFLPGYLDRELVLETRGPILRQLAAAGELDPAYPPEDAMARPGSEITFRAELAIGNQPLKQLLYDGRMMEFYTRFLGGEVRHFDFTWMRAVAPGKGTSPHEDIVFMGRGTTNLYTSWTPLGDISIDLGGLMILEHSHAIERIRNSYGRKDVDSYCLNRDDAATRTAGKQAWNGRLARNPATLRQRLGGRWLTTDYRAGDLLVFGMYTIHASLDNHTSHIRLSSDTRYQLASEPADERWIGENPIAHGQAAKRGRIC